MRFCAYCATEQNQQVQHPTFESGEGTFWDAYLEAIVNDAHAVLASVIDNSHHVVGSLALCHVGLEAVPDPVDGSLALEAREVRRHHQATRRDDVLGVRSAGEESLDSKLAELSVALRVLAAHQRDHFVREFKRVGLEFDALEDGSEISFSTLLDDSRSCLNLLLAVKTENGQRAWRTRVSLAPCSKGIYTEASKKLINIEEEAEVNVRDAPFSVNHDVAVVSVFELEDVAENGVGGHGLDEIAPSSLKCHRLLWTELDQEEGSEVVDLGSSHFIARGSVGDHIDDARPRTSSEHAVRLDLKIEAVDVEHVLELRDDL